LIHNLRKKNSDDDDDENVVLSFMDDSENYNSLNFTLNDDQKDDKESQNGKNDFKSIEFLSMDSNGRPKNSNDIFR